MPVDPNIGEWFQSPDWNAYTLSSPVVQDPGTAFGYNTGLPHLLSAVITKSTGMSTREFADRYLFGPMNITN
jgi:CubicO group peptidase (beta-lactamase class C family)